MALKGVVGEDRTMGWAGGGKIRVQDKAPEQKKTPGRCDAGGESVMGKVRIFHCMS
ncbi:hypothetical protein GCM10008938_49760 [Deinococcus roseus]|uniref:Uncharacterized protein n=1 Tax=Deinococcus roseus TaxID=392414 RepID=A0ABQ2DIT9_9DEIO|nr:hypothetical protein GCM10008938_49760 [Deinococcus roseus]